MSPRELKNHVAFFQSRNNLGAYDTMMLILDFIAEDLEMVNELINFLVKEEQSIVTIE